MKGSDLVIRGANIVTMNREQMTAEAIAIRDGQITSIGNWDDIAHDCGVPIISGAFGVDTGDQVSWKLGRNSVYTALLTPLAGADFVEGLELLKASRVLVPEQIILDDEIYHTNRIIAECIVLNDDTLALDVISKTGPKGNFLR